jgi:hypothetical protein
VGSWEGIDSSKENMKYEGGRRKSGGRRETKGDMKHERRKTKDGVRNDRWDEGNIPR